MRVFLSVLLLSVVGCGGNSGTATDMAMPTDQGATVDLNTSGDLKGGTCSVTAQTGCPTGMRCVPTVQGMSLVGGCAPEGTKAAGDPCTQDTSSMTQYLDDCKAGLLCDNNGPGSTYACRALCKDDTACGTAGRCAGYFGASFGLCLPTCTPSLTSTKGSCATGDSCAELWPAQGNTMTVQKGFFVCKKDGAGTLFSDCMADSDCGAGFDCDLFGGPSQWCAPICDGTHMCPTPPADDAGAITEMCKTYSDTNGIGFCASM
jgi:hypothetical protein